MERLRRRDPLASATLSRLLFALAVSIALHGALLVDFEQGPAPAQPRSLLQARIVTPPPEPVRDTQPVLERRQSVRGTSFATESAPVPEKAVTEVLAEATPNAGEAPAQSGLLPVDPNYYSASEIDIYPMPLRQIPPVEWIAGEGHVQVLASIDETGHVTDVNIFESEPQGVFDAAAMSAIRSTTFSPARKDDRPVRSRVIIELSPAAPRY